MLDVISTDMTLDMMYPHQRFLCCQRISLCSSKTDEKRSYKPRTVGNTDKIHFVHRDLCSIKRLIYYRVDIGQVVPRSDLRHNTPV